MMWRTKRNRMIFVSTVIPSAPYAWPHFLVTRANSVHICRTHGSQMQTLCEHGLCQCMPFAARIAFGR
ncbi:hypothetical protein AFLA_009370 [Aspergillus flavus NRRL3357]|nr:hypothetical protein AFLA_009370 [Aspergillus flavus NRRL3357]